MFLRAESGRSTTNGTAEGEADVRVKGTKRETSGAPNVRGDFDELLSERPVFRTRVNGYDRLQVDNLSLIHI